MRIKEFDLKIKKLSESAVIPEYKTDGASGLIFDRKINTNAV